MRQERAAAVKFGRSMGDSETAQQGSTSEHAGDVTDNGHAGDVANDAVMGVAVPPGTFSLVATLSLQDSLLLMLTEHSNHSSTSSTSQ